MTMKKILSVQYVCNPNISFDHDFESGIPVDNQTDASHELKYGERTRPEPISDQIHTATADINPQQKTIPKDQAMDWDDWDMFEE